MVQRMVVDEWVRVLKGDEEEASLKVWDIDSHALSF